MEISHELAPLLGIMMIVIYGGYLLNQKFYQQFWQNIADLPIILFFQTLLLFSAAFSSSNSLTWALLL